MLISTGDGIGQAWPSEEISLRQEVMNVTASTMRLPLLLILAAALAACVPRPHSAYLRPAGVGIIVDDKKPLADVGLYLGKYPGNNQPCAAVGQPISVAVDGRFAWTPVQERDLTESLINPVALSGTLTALCIRHPEKGVLIGALLFTMQDKPASIRLICDVARPISTGAGPNTVSTPLGQALYCESTTIDQAEKAKVIVRHILHTALSPSYSEQHGPCS